MYDQWQKKIENELISILEGNFSVYNILFYMNISIYVRNQHTALYVVLVFFYILNKYIFWQKQCLFSCGVDCIYTIIAGTILPSDHYYHKLVVYNILLKSSFLVKILRKGENMFMLVVFNCDEFHSV